MSANSEELTSSPPAKKARTDNESSGENSINLNNNNFNNHTVGLCITCVVQSQYNKHFCCKMIMYI
jgi:hypothetical protein